MDENKEMTMQIGYIRVSTIRQARQGTSFEDQRETLKNMGIETIYEDGGYSGKNTHRPGLDALQKSVRPGDTIVITALDRLGRSLRDITTLIEDWRERDINLVSIRENVDTGTPTGIMLAQMLGIVAELERTLILERTEAGREQARKAGKTINRAKSWTDKDAIHVWKMKNENRWTVSDIARTTKSTRQTIYRMLDRANEIKAEA